MFPFDGMVVSHTYAEHTIQYPGPSAYCWYTLDDI